MRVIFFISAQTDFFKSSAIPISGPFMDPFHRQTSWFHFAPLLLVISSIELVLCIGRRGCRLVETASSWRSVLQSHEYLLVCVASPGTMQGAKITLDLICCVLFVLSTVAAGEADMNVSSLRDWQSSHAHLWAGLVAIIERASPHYRLKSLFPRYRDPWLSCNVERAISACA